MITATARTRLSSIGRRFLGPWVQDVPEDIALCEFDCRRRQCRWGEWSTCARRLDHQPAAGKEPPATPSGDRR